jgi:DNA-binding Lrp family transcriptional regulator
MDQVDKRILLELEANCRTSYQTLASKLDLTVNAIKKRMNKLIGTGVIREFRIYLNLAHTNAEILLAVLSTNGIPVTEAFYDTIGAHHLVWAVIPLTNRNILVFADYSGARQLATMGKFLRNLENITEVEIHTLIYEKGQSCEFTSTDAKVLKHLKQDPRMSVSDIVRETGLTPRRVRKILDKFLGEGEGGSTPEFFTPKTSTKDVRTSKACLHFRVIWNLNAAGRTSFFIRINWNEENTTAEELVKWLDSQWPIDYWYTLTSATAPSLFSLFAVEHIKDAQPIANEISQNPAVESVELLIGYPTKWYHSYRETLLDEHIAKADQPT